MNMFVHLKLGHFLMGENDGEGNDLGGEEEHEEEEEQEEEQSEEGGEQEDEDGEDEDEVVLTLGGKTVETEEDAELKAAPQWVKELRKSNREQAKRIRELEAATTQKDQAPQQVAQLGRKPSMDDADIDYEAEKFEAKLTAWHEQKRSIEAQQQNAENERKRAEGDWQKRLSEYEKGKKDLKFKDVEDAEDNVKNSFNVTQQGIIIQGAENPALVVYALGKNPKEAARLAGITDHVKFATAIGRLETQLKVSNKKSAPPPEKTVTGGRAVAGSSDATLERLRAEAERTGDSSKVIAYKRKQKAQAQGRR